MKGALILEICITLSLLLLIYQDFRYRAIHWGLFPLLLVLFLFLSAIEVSWEIVGQHFLINVSFIFFHLMVLTAWFSFRTQQLTVIFDRFLGWGDVLLLVVFAAAFHPVTFVLFLVMGLLLTLGVYSTRMIFTKNRGELIPLAGCLGIFYLLSNAFLLFSPEINRQQNFLDLLLYY